MRFSPSLLEWSSVVARVRAEIERRGDKASEGVGLDLQEQQVSPELLALSAILKSFQPLAIVEQLSLGIGFLKGPMDPMKKVFLE